MAWASPWPVYEQDEVDAVAEVLRSGRVNYWTGEHGAAFEKEFAEFAGCRYAVALANGTVALEAALRALGIGEGDEVVVPARTFIATASSVSMCGARPVVADVDPGDGNISVDTIEKALTRRTRAIVAVHVGGWPCDMPAIMAYARDRGLKVIEDCAQAHGAEIDGRPVGSFGDVAAFSFCQDKILSTGGEGGMLVTGDEQTWKTAWSLKDHGKDRDLALSPNEGNLFRWLHQSFGTNWRMTEMQAVIGRIQLTKLPQWLACRHDNASFLYDALRSVPGLRFPTRRASFRISYYRAYVFVDTECLRPGWTRDRIVKEIRARGVPCSQGSCCEIYRERAFEYAGLVPSEPLPASRMLGESSLCFLVHPGLNREDMSVAAGVVSDVMREAIGKVDERSA